MPETKTNTVTGKGKSIFAISKEVNRQSTEILEYLKRINIEVSGIMSKVDETVYRKVLGHFKSDIEEAEKHKQKLLEFKKKHNTIEINEIEADLKIEKEKRQKEDDERKKRIIEEEKKKADRENQLLKDLEEKKRLIELKKEQIELEKIEQEKAKAREEEERRKKEEEVKRAAESKTKIVEKPAKREEIKPVKKEEIKPAKKEEAVPAKKEEKPKVLPVETKIQKPAEKCKKGFYGDKKFKPRKEFPYHERRRDGGKPPYRPPVTTGERKFEKVTIKEDYKKFKKQKQKAFGRRTKEEERKIDETNRLDSKEKQAIVETPLSPEAEERKRDTEKKNKAKRQKYIDGAEAKKRKKYDEEQLNIEIEEAIRETMAKMDDVWYPFF